jgi:hypothetical protein
MDEETTLTPETDDTEETENSESVDEEIEVSLADEIIAEFTARFENEETFNATLLSQIVNDVIGECVSLRNFPSTYTEDSINEWLASNKSKIKKIVEYDYSIDGANGQSSHSESGVARNYIDRRTLFGWIIPYARF